MRLMMRAMLSTASLSAFSASVMKAGFSPVQASPALRPFGGQAQTAPSPSPAPSGNGGVPQPTPTRGSLLDISV
jgi:hypothetical protein